LKTLKHHTNGASQGSRFGDYQNEIYNAMSNPAFQGRPPSEFKSESTTKNFYLIDIISYHRIPMKRIEIIVSHKIPKDVNPGTFAGLGEGREPGRAGSDATDRGVRSFQDGGLMIAEYGGRYLYEGWKP
jgi:hypothetical protein